MSLVFKEPSADTNCFSDDDEDDIDDNRRGEINTIFFLLLYVTQSFGFYLKLYVYINSTNLMYFTIQF